MAKERLRYVVTRGRNAGVELTPHLYGDGYFRAHGTNSQNDPVAKRVRTEDDLILLVRAGYHVRMSNTARDHPPSTVKPEIVPK